MAARIRGDGTIVCAAMHPAAEGDTYINDGLHYRLSVQLKVLVTEPMDLPEGEGLGGHARHGQWWWANDIPDGAVIDAFYLAPPDYLIPPAPDFCFATGESHEEDTWKPSSPSQLRRSRRRLRPR